MDLSLHLVTVMDITPLLTRTERLSHSEVNFVTERDLTHHFETRKPVVQSSCYRSSSNYTLLHPHRQSQLYIKYTLLEVLAVPVAGLCEKLKHLS